jgi:hypothetical protein
VLALFGAVFEFCAHGRNFTNVEILQTGQFAFFWKEQKPQKQAGLRKRTRRLIWGAAACDRLAHYYVPAPAGSHRERLIKDPPLSGFEAI